MPDYHNIPESCHVVDRRDDYPIFLHSEFDDYLVTGEAFRVYAHLSRRAGRDSFAYPSYASIGKSCFSIAMRTGKDETGKSGRISKPMSESRQKLLAMYAIEELVEAGMIELQPRWSTQGDRTSNLYILLPRSSWKQGGGSPHDPPENGGGGSPHDPQVDRHTIHGGSPHDPKGIPLEGNPKKERKSKNKLSDNPHQEPDSLSLGNFGSEKPTVVNPPVEAQSASLDPKSSVQPPPSFAPPPRRRAAPGLIANQYPYPELMEQGLGHIWIGEGMPKPSCYRAFDPKIIAQVVQHLRTRNLPCLPGDAIGCILNAIRNQEWGKLAGWCEASALQLNATGAASPAHSSTLRMTPEEQEAYMEAEFRRQSANRQISANHGPKSHEKPTCSV